MPLLDDARQHGNDSALHHPDAARHRDDPRAAAESQTGEYLFVTYADFMADPASTLRRIYEFCDWEPFAHNYDQIVCTHPEDDTFYGLAGLHTVRPTVGARAT